MANALPENFLDLPDEELAKIDTSQLAENEPPAEVGGEEDVQAESTAQEDPPLSEQNAEPEPVSDLASPDEEGQESEGASPDPAQPDGDAPDPIQSEEENEPEQAQDSESESPPEPTSEDETDSDSDSDIDPKQFLEAVTKPFTANGREMKVDNPEDVVRLMQMGANYNKKMAALKPNLKLLRMLEKHQLLDEQKLTFLIDVQRKDPKAIAKLLQDSQIDPMDLDTEQGSEYTPGNYAVSEAEMDLANVVSEIKDTPAYAKTTEILTQRWDQDSRDVVGQNPEALRAINAHVNSGVYDIIEAELDKERALGRLRGMSDIEAYNSVGKSLQERGAFDQLAGSPAPNGQQPQRKTAETRKPTQKDDALRDKRRAASPSKSTSAPAKPNFNPLSMSDEEFEKQVDGRLM